MIDMKMKKKIILILGLHPKTQRHLAGVKVCPLIDHQQVISGGETKFENSSTTLEDSNTTHKAAQKNNRATPPIREIKW
jgi:hypothetical protein